jgi:hypothetical protein
VRAGLQCAPTARTPQIQGLHEGHTVVGPVHRYTETDGSIEAWIGKKIAVAE